MKLSSVKKLCEDYPGGIKGLAHAIKMSEQNLHRCIKENKIQAQDLEKIAFELKVPIDYFFEEPYINKKEIKANDHSGASEMGDVFILNDKEKMDCQPNLNSLEMENEMLRKLIEEKERTISEKERIIAEKERLISYLTSNK